MTAQPIRGWTASTVLVGALALSGCGSESDTAKSATPTREAAKTETPTAVTPLPSGLRGSWTRRMRARDWKRAGNGYPLGTWRFDLSREGEVDVYLPRTDSVDFSTQFVVEADHLTIDGIPVCPGKTGRYTWRASPNALTLTVVDDDGCTARAALFGGTWRRRH